MSPRPPFSAQIGTFNFEWSTELDLNHNINLNSILNEFQFILTNNELNFCLMKLELKFSLDSPGHSFLKHSAGPDNITDSGFNVLSVPLWNKV